MVKFNKYYESIRKDFHYLIFFKSFNIVSLISKKFPSRIDFFAINKYEYFKLILIVLFIIFLSLLLTLFLITALPNFFEQRSLYLNY